MYRIGHVILFGRGKHSTPLSAAFHVRTMASGSWSDRLKSLLGLAETRPEAASNLESIDGNVYLQQMKTAAKMGGLAGFARGQVAQATAKALHRQVEILEGLSAQERERLHELEPRAKTRLVQNLGCSPKEVEDVVRKFIATRNVFAKVGQLRREGKPMPQSFEELSNLVGLEPPADTGQKKGVGISRNAPCPCGSGKKFKRCCGK